MTKKKKITIGIIALILAATLITTALVVILTSKFKVKNYTDIRYYNHTTATAISLNEKYERPSSNAYYENGTQLIKDNNEKWGLFSSVTGKILVTPNYYNYSILDTNADTNKTYFKFENSDRKSDGFVIYDEQGNKVFGTLRQQNESYEKIVNARVVTREVDVEDDYEIEEEVERIEVKDITFGKSYKGDNYFYESWIITDTNDVEYINLYNMLDGRKLVQTFGNNVGQNIGDNIDFLDNIEFLSNGEFVFISEETKTISTSSSKLIYKIYNSKLELLNTVELNNSTELSETFRIGDYLFVQRISAGTEDNYDLQYLGIDDTYYNLDTYRINMKNGRINDVSVEFVISELISTTGKFESSEFDINYTLVKAYEIEDKKIDNTKLLLLNSKLETKEIDYTFNKIESISKNRFLVSTDGTSNFTLINKKFEVIADFTDYSEVFTTKDNIIASDTEYTYICNHDGLVIKRYNVGEIINIHNKDYYLIKETATTESETFSYYYQGSNGEKLKLILKENDTTQVGDKINDKDTYSTITKYIEEDYAYMIAYKDNGSNGSYTIYNFNGESLLTFELPAQNITTTHYIYDDNIVVRIGSYSFLLNR